MALFGVFVTGLAGYVLQAVAVLAVVAVLAFLVLRWLNRDAAGNWLHWGRTKAGQAGDYATTLDPAGQMRQAAKDAAAELGTADDALIAADKLKLQLEDQVATETATKTKLEGQVRKLLKPVGEGGKGKTPNDPVVVEKLKRIADLDDSIASTRTQIGTLVANYEKNLKQANAASERIAGALAEADRLGVQLQLGEQNAKVQAMLAKYNPAAVNGKLAALDKYREAAKDKLRGYAAQQKVAADRNQDDDLDDDDDVTPDTDERLGGVLARLQGKKPAAAPAGDE